MKKIRVGDHLIATEALRLTPKATKKFLKTKAHWDKRFLISSRKLFKEIEMGRTRFDIEQGEII